MRMEIRGTASFFHSLLARGSNFKDNRVLPPPPPLCIPSLNSERHSSVHRPLFRRYLVRGEKKKKKRSGRSTRRPILPRAEIKSNVQRPFPIPFPFFSFPDPSHFCPASPLPLSLSSPLLQNSCTLGQIATIRLHRPNNTDSTTTAQSKIGPM